MRLTGKTALITGAARGIGLAIASAFVAEGARVFGVDRDGDALAAALAALNDGDDGAAAWLAGDVTDEATVRSACERAVHRFGALDVLVCNAATYTEPATVEALDTAAWHAALDVNLTSAFYTCKHGIGHLRAAGGGSIVITASQMGSVAWMGSAAYCATKGALIQLARAMALDHAGDGIRVNTLSPGGTLTERLVHKFGDAETAEREWGPKHPLGRLGRAEEIARGAVFLASDESSFMTGADLVMDGGYTAW